MLAASSIPFKLQPSFSLEPTLVYGLHRVDVAVNAVRLSSVPTGARVELGIFKGDDATPLASAASAVDPKNMRFTESVDVAAIPPSDFLMKGLVKNAAGETLAMTAEPFTIPVKPDWYNNTIGITDEVPIPFTPID